MGKRIQKPIAFNIENPDEKKMLEFLEGKSFGRLCKKMILEAMNKEEKEKEKEIEKIIENRRKNDGV